MSWFYQDTLVQDLSQIPDNAIGFIYMITNLDTQEFYIGKKSLYANRTLPPLKGTKRKRKVTKESNWSSYRSSSEIVRNWQSIRKDILQYAFSKKELTYLETKYLFKYDVLEDSKCLNSNILGKFYESDMTN